MEIDDLVNLDIPPEFIEKWKTNGISTLTEVQQVAFSEPSLQKGENIVISAPTSSGKTFIGEVLAVRAASTLHRAIYLVPYKALAEEKFIDFSEMYRDMGISIVVSSGDRSEFDQDIRRGDFGVAIIVYEKLAQLLVQSPGIISDCHILIVDEVQLIRDRVRGPMLELVLTRIKRLAPSPQIICLSATVSDLGLFPSWLNAQVIEVEGRPVPLWEAVIETSSDLVFRNVAEKLTETRNIGNFPTSLNKDEALVFLAQRMADEEQMLIFRTGVDDTERTASKLADTLPFKGVPNAVRERIMLLEDTPLRSFLDKNIEKRVAYHNAGLAVEERRLVENLFREGVLKVIVTTTTLAAGVNLPADQVVIADFRRYDFSKRTRVAIDVSEYKNCVGRAGRYGKRTSGISVILAEQRGQTAALEREFIHGTSEKLESAIPQQSEFSRHILRVIAEQIASNNDDIAALFHDSLAFTDFYEPNGLESEMDNAIESGVVQLLSLDLVHDVGENFEVTELGRVAARSGVAIDTFGELVDLASIDSLDNLDDYDIFTYITGVEEMETLRPYSSQQRAELLNKWIGGESAIDITTEYSGRYSIGYGRIRDLGEVAEWLLLTAAEIGVVAGASEDDIKKLTSLAHQSHFGVPAKLVELSRLRILRRSDLLRLVDNDQGVELTDPHEILDADPTQFVGLLSPQNAEALKAAIARSIGESLNRHKTGHLVRSDKYASIKPLIETVYTAQGNDFERALEGLIGAQLVGLNVRRFTRQRSGEPDLEIIGEEGTIVIQATASEDAQKPVSWNKSREVLGSTGYSGTAGNFVVIAKPDFHSMAINNVKEITDKGERLLLIPVDVAVEMCLQVVEGRISREDMVAMLENRRGYLSRDEIQALD